MASKERLLGEQDTQVHKVELPKLTFASSDEEEEEDGDNTTKQAADASVEDESSDSGSDDSSQASEFEAKKDTPSTCSNIIATFRKQISWVILGLTFIFLGTLVGVFSEYYRVIHYPIRISKINLYIWLVWIGITFCLLPLNKVFTFLLFKLLLKYFSNQSDNTRSDAKRSKQTKWRVLFYFLPIESSCRKVLLVFFSFVTWILLIIFFHFSNDDRVDVMEILLLENYDSDIEIDILLWFYRIFLCLFIANSALLFENIILRVFLSKIYLKKYFRKFENLAKLERNLCIILNVKNIFMPNLTHFLVTYPSHPQPHKYFQTSHLASLCLCTVEAAHAPKPLNLAKHKQKSDNKNVTKNGNDANSSPNTNNNTLNNSPNNLDREESVDSTSKSHVRTFSDFWYKKETFHESSLNLNYTNHGLSSSNLLNFNETSMIYNDCKTELATFRGKRGRKYKTNILVNENCLDHYGRIHVTLWDREAAQTIDRRKMGVIYGNILFNTIAKQLNDINSINRNKLSDKTKSGNVNTANYRTYKNSIYDLYKEKEVSQSRGESPTKSTRNIFGTRKKQSQSLANPNKADKSQKTVKFDEMSPYNSMTSVQSMQSIQTSNLFNGSNSNVTSGATTPNATDQNNNSNNAVTSGNGSTLNVLNSSKKEDGMRNYLIESDFMKLFAKYQEKNQFEPKLVTKFFQKLKLSKNNPNNIYPQELAQVMVIFFKDIVNLRSQFDSLKDILNSLQRAGTIYTHFFLIFFYLLLFNFSFTNAISIYVSLIGIGVLFGSSPITRLINGVTLIFGINAFNVGDVIRVNNGTQQGTYIVLRITLLTTIMKSTYGIVYVWSNNDLLDQISDIINLSGQNSYTNTATRTTPWHKIVFYISYNTSAKTLDLIMEKFKKFILNDRELKIVCSSASVCKYVMNIDEFMTSQCIFAVQSYVSFGNNSLRWRVHSKLHDGLRMILKELNVQPARSLNLINNFEQMDGGNLGNH